MLQENARTEPARLIRVLLADRRRLYCAGLRKVLEETADIQVVDEAYDVFEAQRMAAEMAPDVVLLSALEPLSRLGEAVSDIQTHCPGTAVLVLARNDERLNLAVLWAAGAAGVVDEAAAPESLVAADSPCGSRGVAFHQRTAFFGAAAGRRDQQSLERPDTP